MNYSHYTYYGIVYQVRRHIVHTLVGGGGQHGGFNALDYRKIWHGSAGRLGTYEILSVLPDKFMRFLFEFHSHRFESLNLPVLPADRSDFDVHGALMDDKVLIMYIMHITTLIIFKYYYTFYTNYADYVNYFFNTRKIHRMRGICHGSLSFCIVILA